MSLHITDVFQIIFSSNMFSDKQDNFSLSQLTEIMDSLHWTRNEVRFPAGWGTVTLTILIMITITNILTILTFKNMRRLQLQQYLIVSLAIVDLVTVLPHLIAVVGNFKGYLILNIAICQSIAILNHAVVAVTTWIHCGLCLDKCFSIIKPIMHKRLVSKLQPVGLAATYSGSIVAIIFLLMTSVTLTGVIKAEFNPVMASCVYAIDLSYCLIVGLLFIFIPLVTALVTHILIVWEIRKSNVRCKKRIKRAVKTTALVVGIYYVCWLPYLAFIMFQLFFPNYKMMDIFGFVSADILILNSGTNFFVYLICNKDFRQSLRMILRLKRPEVNPEA